MPKVKLKDVVMRVKEKVDKDNTDLEYYVGGEHIDGNEVCVSRKGVIQGSTIGPAFHMAFKAGDVLLMSRNPHLRKASMVDFDGICSDVSYICRTKDESVLLQSFLPFLMQTNDFWRFAEENKKGGLPFFLNWSDFERYEFELPPIEKQRELSQLLWAMQRTKQAYQNLLAKSDELVKSQFIELFGDPETNPFGWRMGTIRDIVSDVRYGSSRKASIDGKYPYLRMNNITYGGELDLTDVKRIDIPDDEIDRCSVRKGDVLFNRTNSKELVGKTCLYDREELMVLAGFVIRVRVNEKAIPEFLAQYMNLPYTKELLLSMCKAACGQANINAQELQNIPIYIPPVEAQKQFVGFKEQLDKSKFELRQGIANINNLMNSLMQQDFSN